MAILICSVQSLKSQSFTNPIADLADPHITFIDGYYYYLGTTGNDISIKRSVTLEGLKHIGITRLFGSGDSGAQDGNYWAPELFKLDGKWYIYYTASQVGIDSASQRTYVLENTNSDPISGNWVFKGKIFSPGSDYWSIDGTVLEINGNRYFFWSGISASTHFSGGSKPQRNFVSLMSNPWTLTGARTLLTSPGELTGDNLGDVTEAPSTLVHNNKVFLIYSANGCWTNEYKLGVMYADVSSNLLDINVWTKKSDPVLVSNPNTFSYGTGHNSFFKSPDGLENWIAYHATPNPNGDCGNTRTTRVQKFSFDNNGMPNFGEAKQVGKPFNSPSGEVSLPNGVLENGLYKIKQKNTTKVLEIGGALRSNPANVIQWEDNNELWQQWYIQATPDGYFTIISAHSGLGIEVGGCSKDNNANVNIWKPNGASCQLWSIENVGTGDYRIINKNSGKVMQVNSGGINSNGANILQNTWSNANYQKFKLEFIEKTLNSEDLLLRQKVKIYPNPVTDVVYIRGLLEGNNSIKITDVLGRTKKEIKFSGNNCKINVQGLSKGLYIYTITNNEQVIVKKIIHN